MTFSEFTTTWCDVLPEATGDYVTVVASTFLRMSGRPNTVTTQQAVVDSMRGTLYFQPGYAGQCCLKLRAYARA